MKINVTLPVRKRVGSVVISTYYASPDDWHKDGDKTRDLKEFRLQQFTVLDYDFQAARRARAVGHLVHASAHLAIIGSMAAVYVAGQKIGQGMEWVAEKADDLIHLHGVPGRSGIRDTFGAIMADIAGK